MDHLLSSLQVQATTTASAALLKRTASTLDDTLELTQEVRKATAENKGLMETANGKIDVTNGKLENSLEYSHLIEVSGGKGVGWWIVAIVRGGNGGW
jgi:hypothetical protein